MAAAGIVIAGVNMSYGCGEPRPWAWVLLLWVVVVIAGLAYAWIELIP
jgi:hypothetical protein